MNIASNLADYKATGTQLVLSEVSDNAPTSLQAVKLMAQYMATPSARVR